MKALLLIPIAALLIALTGCDLSGCDERAANVRGQGEADALRKQADANTLMNKHMVQVQDDMVKACIAEWSRIAERATHFVTRSLQNPHDEVVLYDGADEFLRLTGETAKAFADWAQWQIDHQIRPVRVG